jgi:hypothetical protein
MRKAPGRGRYHATPWSLIRIGGFLLMHLLGSAPHGFPQGIPDILNRTCSHHSLSRPPLSHTRELDALSLQQYSSNSSHPITDMTRNPPMDESEPINRRVGYSTFPVTTFSPKTVEPCSFSPAEPVDWFGFNRSHALQSFRSRDDRSCCTRHRKLSHRIACYTEKGLCKSNSVHWRPNVTSR